MLHRQRALYVLLAWLGNRSLLALRFIYIVQFSILVGFYKLRSQQVLFCTRKKAVQVKFQKIISVMRCLCSGKLKYCGDVKYCFVESLYNKETIT